MNLTEQELKAIEREAEGIYWEDRVTAYVSAATKYITQERIKAKKLLEVLNALLISGYLPDYAKREIENNINEYNKNS